MRIVIQIPDGNDERVEYIEANAFTVDIRHQREPVFNPFPGLTYGPPSSPKIVLEAHLRDYAIHRKDGEVIEGEILDDVTYSVPAPKEIEG